MKLRFVSKNGGKEALSSDELRIIREFTRWVMEKFVPARTLEDVEIVIHFDSMLLKSVKSHGESIWEGEDHVRPRSFSIYIDTSNKFQDIMHTVAHELVHVKQWVLGEFYQRIRRDGVHVYMGEEWNEADHDYWDLPWEIEAHGRALGLVRQFIAVTGRKKEKWARAKMTY